MLCRWHVKHTEIYISSQRAWKNKIRSVAPQNQAELYQTLCILSSEMDVNVFQTRIAQFTKVWTPIEPDFIKYFSEHYQSRAGMVILVISTLVYHNSIEREIVYIYVRTYK